LSILPWSGDARPVRSTPEDWVFPRSAPPCSPQWRGILARRRRPRPGHQFNDDVPGAIQTTRVARKLLLDNGASEDSTDVITSYSNEALMLAGLSRFDEALVLHQRVVELRARALGADAVATMQERVFYGYTLNRARRFEAALGQFRLALPLLEKELGNAHDSTQQANLGLGRALVGLGRDREALAPLSAAHVYGQTHPFEERQGPVGYYLAQANARLGRCEDARRVLLSLQAHAQALPQDQGDPLKDTRCEASGSQRR
jgi:tetratricopeptide (TPR) repeat protein